MLAGFSLLVKPFLANVYFLDISTSYSLLPLVNKEKLFEECLTQITKLGIPTEQYLTGEYFGLNTHKRENDLWEVWIILEWDEHFTNWTSSVKCIVSESLQIQQYTLLTKKPNGSITENFRYP